MLFSSYFRRYILSARQLAAVWLLCDSRNNCEYCWYDSMTVQGMPDILVVSRKMLISSQFINVWPTLLFPSLLSWRVIFIFRHTTISKCSNFLCLSQTSCVDVFDIWYKHRRLQLLNPNKLQKQHEIFPATFYFGNVSGFDAVLCQVNAPA